MNHVNVSQPLDPAYPFGSAIKDAKLELEVELEPMAKAILWIIKLILSLEPLPFVRDTAIEKLKASLLGLPLHSVGTQQLAGRAVQ